MVVRTFISPVFLTLLLLLPSTFAQDETTSLVEAYDSMSIYRGAIYMDSYDMWPFTFMENVSIPPSLFCSSIRKMSLFRVTFAMSRVSMTS